jgi:hypothetical protein
MDPIVITQEMVWGVVIVTILVNALNTFWP